MGEIFQIMLSGFVIDFVSGPVSSGFTSAVALIIVTSQVKDLLGIGKYVKGNTFVEMWTDIINNFDKVRYPDVLLGITCITVLLLLRVRRVTHPCTFLLSNYLKRNVHAAPSEMIEIFVVGRGKYIKCNYKRETFI